MKGLFLILIFASMLFAHSGRTDSSGGHNNRSTGQYHYHGGYSTPKYTPTQSSYQCGQKTYCYEMTSCKEVMFYFNKCGLSRLDGDNDGVPCEKLCR